MDKPPPPSKVPGTGSAWDRWLALAHAIDFLNDGVGRSVAWLTAVMVLVTFTDALMRYALNTSFVFVQEVEWHLFAVVFLLAAGYTQLKGGHVRVDIVYARLAPRVRAWIDLVFCLLFLFPTCYLVITTSLPFVARSWAAWETSADPGGLPLRFVLKAVIPLGFSLIGLQGVSETIKNAASLFPTSPLRKGKNR